jgi:hypothetical protein
VTKKQLKQLAKKIADLEYTIQTSNDKNAVDLAKATMIKAQESADMELEEMVLLDEMVKKYLKEKNI